MGTLGHELQSTARATKSPTMREIAWAAGIFEGEGYVGGNGRRGPGYSTNPYAHIVQKDPWLLEKMRDLFGGTIHYGSPKSGKLEPCSALYLTGARGRGFLLTIYSFLSPRRQARIRLEFEKSRGSRKQWTRKSTPGE